MADPLVFESTVHHFFRHQAGKMVAVLTRIFGTHNLQLAEDVVQDSLLAALEQWKICFHTARSDSRLSDAGEIILLPQQDRRQWDQALIAQGSIYMNQAAYGTTMSTYHLEAAIAYEHCTATSFEATNWSNILQFYTWLCQLAPSPITTLNKAIAVLRVDGPQAALQELADISPQKKITGHYLYHGLLGETHKRLGDKDLARQHSATAIQLTRSEVERKMLEGKMEEVR